MEEEWRTIKDFTDYQVSNLGRVKRLTQSRNHHKTQKILKPAVSKSTVKNNFKKHTPMVVMYKEGKPFTRSVCRLVLYAFIGKPSIKRNQCNHIDGNRKNNIATNLEWVSGSENVRHAVRTGLRHQCGEQIGMSKLKSTDIPVIREMLTTGKYYLWEIGEKFGVKKCAIHAIKQGRAWIHIP